MNLYLCNNLGRIWSWRI